MQLEQDGRQVTELEEGAETAYFWVRLVLD